MFIVTDFPNLLAYNRKAMEVIMKKTAHFISHHSLGIVILSILLLFPALWGYVNTKINYDILVYLPEDIETVQGQDILTKEFGIGAFSFVTVENMASRDLYELKTKIQKITGVKQVLSIEDVTDTTIPLSMLPDEVLEKVYHAEETVMVVTFQDSISNEKTIDAVEKLRTTVKDASSVSGMTAMVIDTMDISNQEIVAYIVIAVSLCLVVLFLATDSYLIPFFLLGNIGFAILYNMGSNIFLGEISYITKAITAVLQLGVTTDFSIFLYHKYEQAKDGNKDKKCAMEVAICETFQSIVGSSLTTIAGFLALCFMDLTLGKDIGIVMAKGVVWGLVCVLTLFPALLLVFDQYIEKTKHKNYLPQFSKIQDFVICHQKLIIGCFLILLVPAIYGNSHYQVYYKLDESLPEDLPSRVANSRLAEKFGITSPEIILIDKNLKPNDMEELVQDLQNIQGIDLVLAPSSLLGFGIPVEMLPEEVTSIFQNDKYQLILLNSRYEVASSELNTQIDTIEKMVKKIDKHAIIAGEGALTKDLVETTDHDFKVVNYLSIIVIFILMLIVLKSVSLPFILVITIEFAIFLNLAISWATNTTLPFIASIVIGTIQLGATIDYAILMSTKYLESRKKEKDKKKAMRYTLEKTVPSIVVSAFCFFAATFGVAIYSKIDMIGAICNLLSRGAIISMCVVVLVLPALLLAFDGLIMKTTKIRKEGSI